MNSERWYYDFFPIFRHVAASWWPNTEINITQCCTLIDFIICHKFAIHSACKLWAGTMIFRLLDISMPPGGQIHKSILLKCSTLIHFIICYKIAIHCVCKLWKERDYDFFQFLNMPLPRGGQIQKSIWLKCCTLIDFMIFHKFTIHCVCKLWTGNNDMIFSNF